jgi:hypothetical protein
MIIKIIIERMDAASSRINFDFDLCPAKKLDNKSPKNMRRESIYSIFVF